MSASMRESGACSRWAEFDGAAARPSPIAARTSSSTYGRPTLILAPNKTLAAQLYGEMKELFPNNAVQYFVSYYDYYQPEAYVPSTDTFIEKDAIINDAIDRMRHAATHALLSRPDVIIVAVGELHLRHRLGRELHGLLIQLEQGRSSAATSCCAPRRHPVRAQRRRLPPRHVPRARRRRRDLPRLRGERRDPRRVLRRRGRGHPRSTRCAARCSAASRVYASSRARTTSPSSSSCARHRGIREPSCASGLDFYDREGRFLEKQRLEQRTMYDLEMLEQMGFCTGIENYSRHLSGRVRASRRRP
jgi:excinuclease ABC subunit B